MSRLQTIFLSFLLATTTIFALPNPIPANIKGISPYATIAAPSTLPSTNKQVDCERVGVSVPILLNLSTTLEAITLHSIHPPWSNTEPSIESDKVTRLPFTRTSTGREPGHFYTTVLVAHRNSVPCLTGRRRRLGPRRAFIATSIGTFRFDMCLPFCSLPTLQARTMLTRCVEATTARTPQEIPTVDLCSDILERLFLRILVGMMQHGAISASRIEQLDYPVKWEVKKRRRTGRECSVSDIVDIMRQL